MIYYFNIEIAKDYGVNEAIMLQNLCFWQNNNKVNEKNFYDERYWTYNSVQAFGKLFPFWSKHQISRILISLENYKLVVVGNYNKMKIDRTKWYSVEDFIMEKHFAKNGNAINENDKTISQKTEMQLAKNGNAISEKRKPIPDSKPIKKTNNKDITHSENASESVTCFSFQEFFDTYNKKKDRKRAETIYNKLSEKDRQAIKDTIHQYMSVHSDTQYRKYPTTYLNGRNWEDDLTDFSKITNISNPKKQEIEDQFGYA